ncbi:MAG: single-stranded DNA-binding protein [Bacteroidaceae bacterium]|nr:single-stranded DNA-binding protein [Bacteroidaceae bacterium]
MAYIPLGGVVKLSETDRIVWGEVSRDAQLVSTKSGGYFVKFGICAGSDKNGEKKYIDCKSFLKGIVGYAKDFQRGDPILAVGRMESREYDGKTYWDLNLGFCISPCVVPDMGEAAAALAQTAKAAGEAAADGPQFAEVDDDEDGELPF